MLVDRIENHWITSIRRWNWWWNIVYGNNIFLSESLNTFSYLICVYSLLTRPQYLKNVYTGLLAIIQKILELPSTTCWKTKWNPSLEYIWNAIEWYRKPASRNPCSTRTKTLISYRILAVSFKPLSVKQKNTMYRKVRFQSSAQPQISPNGVHVRLLAVKDYKPEHESTPTPESRRKRAVTYNWCLKNFAWLLFYARTSWINFY